MKQGWEIKRLPDVVWFQEGPGVRKHQYTTSGVKLLNVANLVNGKVDLSTSDRYISEEEAYGRYNHFLADEGDLILASSGIQVEYIEKKMGFIHKEHLPLCMNTSTIRFKPVDKECFNIRYFMFFLKSYNFKVQLYKLITGIAQLNFGPLHLNQMNIPVPPREEQERIVEELDCLSGVIEKKREQLKRLDALAQSIFYQMFGDPITNEKGWKVNIIGNLAEFYNGVAHEGSISEDGQYDVINSKFISTQGEIRKHCDSQIFPLMKNDIVMVMSDVPNGKALAKCYLIETNDKYTLNQRICAFRNYNCFKPIFLYYYLNRHPYYLRFNDGNGQTNLRNNDVLNCPVYIPPLTLQQEFADKIEAIEKQKELIKKSISETENLFNARMDYYFN